MPTRSTFADCLVEDDKIRKFIKNKYYDNAISKITIERAADKVVVSIYTARPATLIGKAGAGVEAITKEVQGLIASGKKVSINVMEVKHFDADAQLVAESIAKQLENRASFRRSMKQAMARAMKAGAKGVKVKVSGRLGRRRDREKRELSRGFHSSSDAPCGHRLRRGESQHHLRCHRRQVLDLQGRSPRQESRGRR